MERGHYQLFTTRSLCNPSTAQEHDNIRNFHGSIQPRTKGESQRDSYQRAVCESQK